MQHRSQTLECTPEDFRPRTSRAEAPLTLAVADPADVDRCRHLWTAVGHGFWTERCRWDEARWRARLGQPGVSYLIARVGGEDVGGCELIRSARGAKIEGFGLLPAWRGRGLGRDLLTAVTGRAFADGAAKVWLHTATDDHPHALPNYLAAGYRVVRERPLRNPMPPRGPGDGDGAPSRPGI
jgi:ribosomal protein S18 acetylase RimI-like enzyme